MFFSHIITTNSWSTKAILFIFLSYFFLENLSEVSTNYNTFKYSIIHIFRKYRLPVKILSTKLTRQIVYKAAFYDKVAHEMRATHPNI